MLDMNVVALRGAYSAKCDGTLNRTMAVAHSSAPRIALLSLPVLPMKKETASRLASLLLLLRTGGWHTLILPPSTALASDQRAFEELVAALPASASPPRTAASDKDSTWPPPLPPAELCALPPLVLTPVSGCPAMNVADAVAAAYRSGADTLLWLPHWDSDSFMLTHWPRYYGPATPLDVVKESTSSPVAWTRERDTSGPRVLDAFRAEVDRNVASKALMLCSRQGCPALQIGLCPSKDLTFTEAPGLLVGSSALDALALSDVAVNMLAFRPAFPLVAAASTIIALHGAAAGFHLLATAFGKGPFGARGWHAALTAPGSLCGSAVAAGASKEPLVLASPSHPAQDELNFQRRQPRQSSGDVDSDATGMALIAQVAEAVQRRFGGWRESDRDIIRRAWLESEHTVPYAMCQSSNRTSNRPLTRLFAPAANESHSYAGGGCRAACPPRRDILLAVVFNANWVDANYELLHALYDRYFPVIFMFAATDRSPESAEWNARWHDSNDPALPPRGWDDARRGVYWCNTGVPADGYSAHVCFPRIAALAVGRVGVLWSMDDVLLHVWNLDAYSARRLWRIQIKLPDRWLLPGTHAPHFIQSVAKWADAWHTSSMRAMQAHNFVFAATTAMRAEAAAAKEQHPLLRLMGGPSDTLYVPHSIVPMWGTFLSEEIALTMHQEFAMQSMIAASYFLPDAQEIAYQWVTRYEYNASAPLVLPATAAASHPWKMSNPRVRAFVRDTFKNTFAGDPAETW